MRFPIKQIKTSKSGFSLIELMVVIAIIAILSGVTIPNLIGTRNDRMLKNAARNLLGDIHKTRMGAINQNQNWSINFATGGYQVQNAVGVVKKTVTFASKKSGVSYGPGAAIGNPIGTTFDTDFITYPPLGAGVGNILTFNSTGTCNAGYVYLTNTKGTVYGIGTLSSGVTIFKQWMGTVGTGNWTN